MTLGQKHHRDSCCPIVKAAAEELVSELQEMEDPGEMLCEENGNLSHFVAKTADELAASCRSLLAAASVKQHEMVLFLAGHCEHLAMIQAGSGTGNETLWPACGVLQAKRPETTEAAMFGRPSGFWVGVYWVEFREHDR